MTGELGSIAHYNLLERVGESGFGEVYRARDTKVGRTVALKLVPEGFADGQRYERLVHDARAAAGLSHPNIATVFDVGRHRGGLYLACEYVQGETLRQQMAAGVMNSAHALDVAVQVADALADGHSRGVVHKDLRPDTILETAKGSVKLLDFGLSLWTPGGRTRALAAAAPDSVGREALGIVSYMSPEQALGSTVDARSDLFSLGIILYEMLTGKNPFAAADIGATLVQVIQSVPPPPSAINPDLPGVVDGVLSRALTRDLTQRTASAAALAAELRRCREVLDENTAEPGLARSRTARGPADVLPIEEERGGSGLWWLLAILLAAVGAVGYFWLG